MKKLYAVLCGAIVFGSSLFAEENVKPNVVGFYKISTPPGKYVLISCAFKPVGENNKISIQNIFNKEELNAGSAHEVSQCDQVYIPKGTNFVFVYFGREGDESKWLDEEGKPAKISFSVGESFWFKRTADSTKTKLTLSGEAPTNTTVTLGLPKGFSVVQ